MLVPITRSDDPELVLTCARRFVHPWRRGRLPGGRRTRKMPTWCAPPARGGGGDRLPPGLVEAVGPLSTLVSRYGIEVTPYVAFIPDSVEYQPNDGEIAAVFNVPLSFFRDDPREVTHRIDYFGRSWYVPSYRFGEFKIWGLTAIMVVGVGQPAVRRPHRPEHAAGFVHQTGS